MIQLGLADECCEAMHVPLAIQNVLQHVTLSSQLLSSIKATFIEGQNANEVM